jgi:hypothetical protein
MERARAGCVRIDRLDWHAAKGLVRHEMNALLLIEI